MKKFTLLATMLVAAYSAYAADPIYSAAFTADDGFSQQDFNFWTVVDNNQDEKTWIFAEDATPSRVYYNYHSTNAGDDWLFSPEITIPTAGSYIIRYNCTGSSYGEAMEVWHGSDASIEAMTHKGSEMTDIKGSPTAGYYIFNFEEDQKIRLGFHAISQCDKFRLYLNSVSISPISNPVDLGVSEIISPVSGENLAQENVTVKVTNFLDTDANGFDISYVVNDNTPITEHVDATLAGGQSMEYTFNTKMDCSTPREKYNLKVYTSDPNDVAPENNSIESTIKHVAPAAVPYKNGFEPDDDVSNFKFFNLNDDDGDWSIGVNSFFSTFSRTGNGYLAYNYNKNNDGDDWVMIDPLEVEAGDYLIRFWYTATENHTEKLRVCWGTEATPEAMTNEICRIDPMTNAEYKESISIFNVPANQKIFIGFYAYSPADENWMIIDDLSIEKVDPTKSDIVVDELSEPGDYLRATNRRNVVTNIQNIAVRDAEVDITLSIDGNTIETRHETIGFMASKTITFENAVANMADGKHNVKVTVTCDNDMNIDNNVAEKEITIIEQPAALLYDFEDGDFSEDLTYRVEDSATIASAAAESYGEKGGAILEVQDHYLYGTSVLALCTWFSDETIAADRFLVLPKVHIGDENCHFIWDASALSTTNYEDYNICVSTNNDVWYDYTTIAKITGENEYAKTRGVSLADYSGKDVYIALNIRTKNGNALVLDNIGLYGNISKTTGIDIIKDDNCPEIKYNGSVITANDNVQFIINDMNGAIVAAEYGQSINVELLPSGVYVAKAITQNGTQTIKFVK